SYEKPKINKRKKSNDNNHSKLLQMRKELQQEDYITKQDGGVRKLFFNLEIALIRLGVVENLKFNEFTHQVFFNNRPVEDLDLIKMKSDISKEILQDFDIKIIMQALLKKSQMRSYHP